MAAAVVKTGEMEFSVCVNGSPWENTFDKIWYPRFAPDGRLTAIVSDTGQWTLAVDGTPWDFGHELLPDDFDKIEDSIAFAYKRFPALEKAGVKSVIHGPFTFAPDGNPLVGPVPGMRNYWSACAVMALRSMFHSESNTSPAPTRPPPSTLRVTTLRPSTANTVSSTDSARGIGIVSPILGTTPPGTWRWRARAGAPGSRGSSSRGRPRSGSPWSAAWG